VLTLSAGSREDVFLVLKEILKKGPAHMVDEEENIVHNEQPERKLIPTVNIQ